MTNAQSPRGVTLLELMVTLAIAAILATLAAPSLQAIVIRNNTAAIANEFTGSVLRARNAAVNNNRCTTLCRSNDTEAATPQCAADTTGDWNKGWMVFLNRGCDASGTPALDQIIHVVNPAKQGYTLARVTTSSTSPSTSTSTPDIIVFSPLGYPQLANVGGFDLKYGSEARASNRRICLNSLGQVITVDVETTCP